MSEASENIDARIAELADWREAALARMRALIHAADRGGAVAFNLATKNSRQRATREAT